MSLKRVLLAAGAATVLVAGLAPIAQAAQVNDGNCIERHDDPGAQHRLRDTLERPTVDRLQGWIARHPKLADRASRAAAANEIATIRTWIHVIRANNTIAGGNIPRARIDDQISVLNDSFAGVTGGPDSGFRFELAGVTRTTSADWFDMHSQGQDRKMKLALKRGGLRVLNIYTVNHRTLLGYAWLAQDAEQVGVLDGVVVHFQTLPGGNDEIYSEGDTAVHEVGHWLDLFHTFDGGCNRGDMVADTAPEASPAFNCPVGRDTCEGGGLDPIRNFMDYTQDSCMFRFSAGQGARMRQAWAAFRA
jgi:Pregnancy-associated plasma protein-A